MPQNELFRRCLAKIPEDVSKEVEMSFGIADRITELLKERGLSQKEFAKRMGKTETEVSRCVSGTHNFTLRTIAKISSVLGDELISIK